MKENIKMFFVHSFRLAAAAFVISVVVLAGTVVLGAIGRILWKALLIGFNYFA
jgi:hypothetical protein